MVVGYPWAESFSPYCQSGGFDTWLWFLEQLAAVDDPLSSLVSELFSLGCGWLSVMGPDPATCDKSAPLRGLLFTEQPRPSGTAAYGRTVLQETPAWPEQISMDLDKTVQMLNHVSTILESEAYKGSVKVINSGLTLLCATLTYLPTVQDASEEIVGGSGEPAFVIQNMQKKLSLVLDSMSSPSDDTLELVRINI